MSGRDDDVDLQLADTRPSEGPGDVFAITSVDGPVPQAPFSL